MPTDADQFARLRRMLERSHPSEWTREAFPGDVAAICWAVGRIAELEGALELWSKNKPLTWTTSGTKEIADAAKD